MTQESPRLIAFKEWQRLNATNTKRVAREVGMSNSTLASFIQGDTYNLSSASEQKIANHFGLAIEDIFVRPVKMGEVRRRGVPVVGKAAAGPDGSYISIESEGEELSPFDPDECVAVIIEGVSMVPWIYPGEKAIFGRPYEEIDALVNQRVLVQTADERQMVKILRRGTKRGLWDLQSINPAFEIIEGVQIEWARPYRGTHV